MKVLRLVLLISLSIILGLGQEISERSVYLLSHEWCRKCDKVIQILQKLQTNFGKVHSQNENLSVHFFHLFDDFHDSNSQAIKSQDNLRMQVIYQRIQQKYGILRQQVPFPTIWISCPNFEGIYQNQLNYLELEYWINLHCFSKLPNCTQKKLSKEDYQFTLSFEEFSSGQKQIYEWQLQYPFAKYCLKENKNQLNPLETNQLELGPLFFSSFNHNVRDYLFESQKLGIFIVFSSPNHPKVRQFIEIYKFISDLMQGNRNIHTNQGKLSAIFGHNSSHSQELQSQYHQSSIKNFNIKPKLQTFKNLAFIVACSNDNRRDCIMKYEYSVDENKGKPKDPSQKPNITKYQIPLSFAGTKKQNIQRLFEYAHIGNKIQLQSEQGKTKNNGVQIVAFNFDRKSRSIKGFQFDDIEINLGNSFLFWIENVYNHVMGSQKDLKTQNEAQIYCLSSELTHAISERNLTTVKHNIKVMKLIQSLNEFRGPKDQIKLVTIESESEPYKMKQFQLLNSKKWKSQHFKLCLKDQQARYLDYDQVISQLEKIKPQGENLNFEL